MSSCLQNEKKPKNEKPRQKRTAALWPVSGLQLRPEHCFFKFWKIQHHQTNPSNIHTGNFSTSIKWTLTKYKPRKCKTPHLPNTSSLGFCCRQQVSCRLSNIDAILSSLYSKRLNLERIFWLTFWKKKEKQTLILVPVDAATITAPFISVSPFTNSSPKNVKACFDGLLLMCRAVSGLGLESDARSCWGKWPSELNLYLPALAGSAGKDQYLLSLALLLYFLYVCGLLWTSKKLFPVSLASQSVISIQPKFMRKISSNTKRQQDKHQEIKENQSPAKNSFYELMKRDCESWDCSAWRRSRLHPINM